MVEIKVSPSMNNDSRVTIIILYDNIKVVLVVNDNKVVTFLLWSKTLIMVMLTTSPIFFSASDKL